MESSNDTVTDAIRIPLRYDLGATTEFTNVAFILRDIICRHTFHQGLGGELRLTKPRTYMRRTVKIDTTPIVKRVIRSPDTGNVNYSRNRLEQPVSRVGFRQLIHVFTGTFT